MSSFFAHKANVKLALAQTTGQIAILAKSVIKGEGEGHNVTLHPPLDTLFVI
jgi:hypothetical protein